MFSARFSRSATAYKYGPTRWLELIWAANKIDKAMFGEPTIVHDAPRAGDYCEEYEHARVFFPSDDPVTVVVQAKTEYGNTVLVQANDAMLKEAVK